MEKFGKLMSSSFNMLSLSCPLNVLTKQLDISCFDISKMSGVRSLAGSKSSEHGDT